MRTTLTIDDDVAALMERVRKKRGTGLKELVNEALRLGLSAMTAPRPERTPFRTRSVELGQPKIGSIDNIGEALAIAEAEGYR